MTCSLKLSFSIFSISRGTCMVNVRTFSYYSRASASFTSGDSCPTFSIRVSHPEALSGQPELSTAQEQPLVKMRRDERTCATRWKNTVERPMALYLFIYLFSINSAFLFRGISVPAAEPGHISLCVISSKVNKISFPLLSEHW